MKKPIIFISIAIFSLAFTTANASPKSDLQKYMTSVESFIKICKQAAADYNLDKKEIENIKKNYDKIINFSNELNKKYDRKNAKTDKELKAAIDFYTTQINNEKKLIGLQEDLQKAIDMLKSCKGYLELNL